MEYKIKSIKHSGAKGVRGTDRTDGRYPMRIGRTVDLPLDYYPFYTAITAGYPLIANYLKDSDGYDYSGKMLWTSPVVDVDISDNLDVVVVETENSIFEFAMVECE